MIDKLFNNLFSFKLGIEGLNLGKHYIPSSFCHFLREVTFLCNRYGTNPGLYAKLHAKNAFL